MLGGEPSARSKTQFPIFGSTGPSTSVRALERLSAAQLFLRSPYALRGLAEAGEKADRELWAS